MLFFNFFNIELLKLHIVNFNARRCEVQFYYLVNSLIYIFLSVNYLNEIRWCDRLNFLVVWSELPCGKLTLVVSNELPHGTKLTPLYNKSKLPRLIKWTSFFKEKHELFLLMNEFLFLLLGKMWTSGYGRIELLFLNFTELPIFS